MGLEKITIPRPTPRGISCRTSRACLPNSLRRRIYQGYFREIFPNGIPRWATFGVGVRYSFT